MLRVLAGFPLCRDLIGASLIEFSSVFIGAIFAGRLSHSGSTRCYNLRDDWVHQDFDFIHIGSGLGIEVFLRGIHRSLAEGLTIRGMELLMNQSQITRPKP